MADAVEKSDVQSLVFSSHARLGSMNALWLTVQDTASARRALLDLVSDTVSFGLPERARTASVQLLLSAEGLAGLDAPTDEAESLGREFQQGIVVPHRSRALGDEGRNNPAKWLWRDTTTHALVLVYAASADDVSEETDRILKKLGDGWAQVRRLSTRLDEREPFGFRDGLSGVRIDAGGEGAPVRAGVDLLPPGEVLLGHRNALGETPAVSAIAHNGAYVVVRQLAQDVERFWRFFRQQGQDDEEAVWLAAKAVGRWPNGTLASGSTPGPEPESTDTARGALSFRGDPFGDGCPLGSHIRRANPRDGSERNTELSHKIVNTHRIMRRGRMYGPRPPEKWRPSSVNTAVGPGAAVDPSGDERGLLFICLCSDIARQFEFIQHTWLNNPKHVSPYNEVDPIVSGDNIAGDARRFTIPRQPLRRRVSGLEGWVTVRGGGYFILPGRRALISLLSD